MAQPTPFNRLVNFVAYQLAHTDEPYNPADHDLEWVNAEITLDGILTNLAKIQRDDGSLANGAVHQDALSTAVLLIIESAGSATGLAALIQGDWATTTAYTVGQIVQESTTSYVCAEAHTSGTFATDYAAGKWIILGDTTPVNAAALPFTPAGNIVATDTQAAIVELDNEKAKKNGDAAELFAVKDAVDDKDAVNAGQIQRNDVAYVAATGTGDALLATIVSGLTVLSNGFRVSVKAPGANTVTAPTLNLTLGSTSTSALAIVKGNGVALVAGDISSNQIELMYDSALTKWVLLNPIFAVGSSSSDAAFSAPKNLGIAFSVGSSALTAALKTAAGSDASSTDKVSVPMRSSTLANGTYNVREVTAALTLVISSGSTLGHSSATEGILHWYLIDNAGTLELAVSSKYHGDSGIVTTVAEGGAGGADSATDMYSTSARAAVPFQWVAKTLDTQTTAGTWAAVPTATNLSIAQEDATSTTKGGVFVPRAHIRGCNLNPDDTTTLPIGAGQVVDDTNEVMFNCAAINKTNGSWAVGSGNGGLDTGSIAANTFYAVFEIRRSDTGVQDALLSLSKSSPTMPASYDQKRFIGWVETDGSNQFIAHVYNGGHVMRKSSATALSTSSGTPTLRTISGIPADKVLAKFNVYVAEAHSTFAGVSHWDPALGSTNPTGDNGRIRHDSSATTGGHSAEIEVYTNSSGQIYNESQGTLGAYSAETLGWYDDRGQND